MITRNHIDQFISRHRLPAGFHDLIRDHYNPLIDWLIGKRRAGKPLFVGISGAQGTGKSTLTDYLRLALTEDEAWRVAALSLDDFYLTRKERLTLSKTIHPLLSTRGVPGTHDLKLLSSSIERLLRLEPGHKLALPAFDKAKDDRTPVSAWPIVTGPVDLIILEGWCIGSTPQTHEALLQPVNDLERDTDPTGAWRGYVNQRLDEEYADLFAELDYLFYLQAPDFKAVLRWRLEQEEKLAAISAPDDIGIMDRAKITTFLQHFERLTRANFISLPEIADLVLELDDNHDCIRSIYKTR
jgi:D-glycerate 3-kinase